MLTTSLELIKLDFISKSLIKTIEEIGSSNDLQVVTDNVANCKAAGRKYKRYTSIFFGHHVLSIL